jgi:hypothetical protein
MHEKDTRRLHERWAHFRLNVVGHLLAAPPRRGELQGELRRLAEKEWKHPLTGEPSRFGLSTIERWFHEARTAGADPVGALRKKVRRDSGCQWAMPEGLKQALQEQYRAHPSWSFQLHHDNLRALLKAQPEPGPPPSYGTVRRYMRASGLTRRRRLSNKDTDGARRAQARLESREVRSFEAEYVNGLWHWDGHVGSRKVLTPAGDFERPILIGVLDDCSRVGCHLQWYLGDERAEIVAHTLLQAAV